MPVIAIEGLDGSGKTSVCHSLARLLGCNVVEKPLRWLLLEPSGEDLGSYYEVVNRVNALEDPACRQWFYGLGWLLLHRRYPESLVIVDRYVISSLSYNDGVNFDSICTQLISITGVPFFTILLDVSAQERRRRIALRCADEVIPQEDSTEATRVEKMKAFLLLNGWPHLVVPTDGLSPDKVAAKIHTVVGPLATAAGLTNAERDVRWS
jgi:thymidylate kinase